MKKTTIEEILFIVRELNNDPFREQLTTENSLEDALTELQFYLKNYLSNKEKINIIIEHILNFNIGNFSKSLPISDQQNELDVICMGLNTFAEELKVNAVNIKAFDNVFNSLDSPFFVIDIFEKIITKYNDSTLTFFEYSKANKFQIPIDEILDQTIIKETEEFYSSNEKNTSFKHSIDKKNNTTHIVCNLSKLDTAYYSKPSISVFITNITAQVENEKLIKAKELAEHSAKMKEEFLANMSHEIRTPMNAVLGLSNLLSKSKNLDNKQVDYLKSISINSKNLLNIINDILDYSKMESGKIEFEIQPFNLKKEILASREAIQHNITEKGIELETDIDERIPSFLQGDPLRLNQILINLLSNAIKFTEKGKVFLGVYLENKESNNAYVKFIVKDTGIGIPKEKQAAIFDSFTQASSSTTRKYGGTGLGLTIVKKLISLHNSEIFLKSELGEGSEFSFVIKYEIDNSSISNNITANATINKSNFSLDHLRILLAEDNSFNQMVACDTIKDWNPKIEIDIAENGLEAIKKLQEKKYDLILMDIQMPEMDGHIATNIIRNKLPAPINSIPIIAMTAHALIQEVETHMKNGMNDYISKPFEPETLFNKIHKAIYPELSGTDLQNERNFSSTQIIDKDVLYSFSKGNKDKAAKMINLFLSDTPNELIQIQNLLQQKNFKAIKSLAHSIKPKMTYIGSPQLAHIAEQIEINFENTVETEKLVRVLIEKTEIAFDELKKMLVSE